MNLRTLVDAVKWHVRGEFSMPALRSIGFAARGAFQLDEIYARKRMAREQPRGELAIDQQCGYTRLAADARFDELARIGSALAAASAGRSMGGKDFFRARFSTDDEVEILLRAALDRRIVYAVTSYLGTVPVICEADYYCSVPHGPPWSKSQLWHCDDDGDRLVKLFVYCEDVGSDVGPFECIDAQASARARSGLHYRYAGRRYRVNDDAMSARVQRSEHLVFEGPRTSGFLIDTSRCFHRGSRIAARDKRRVAAIVTFLQPNAKRLPLRLRNSDAPLARFAERFTDPLARAMLGVAVA